MKTPRWGFCVARSMSDGVPVGGDVCGSWSGSPQIPGRAEEPNHVPGPRQMGEMGVRLGSPFEMSMLAFPVWVEGLLPLGHGPVLRRKYTK